MFTITVYYHKIGQLPRNYSYTALPEAVAQAAHYSKKGEVRKVSISLSLGVYENGSYVKPI